MRYVLALVAGYYVLEALRHFVRQLSKWGAEERALHIGYRAMIFVLILLTCMFWPVMFFRVQRRA